MSFLAPLMLWGAAAASIPIILHFFFRSRYRKVPWAAMEFLLASIEQTSRRLKFQEILLLIVRCAVLVLIALALARPMLSASKMFSGGDSVDAVFVMDTSYSMTARDGKGTRLDHAKAAALKVLDNLPPHSTCQVIAVGDRVTQAGPRVTSNRDQARQLIEKLQASQLASDLAPGVEEAVKAIERGQLPNKELYVFSDMQRLGWDAQSGLVVDKMKDIGEDATIYLVRAGSQEPRNATILDIVPQAGIPHTGDRAGFVVFVRNSGRHPVENLLVSLEVDGQEQGKEQYPIPVLGKGETKAVPLTAKLDKAGFRIITAKLNHDDLEADNRLDRLIEVRDQVRVLVIDGSPNDREPEKAGSYFLLHSLRPVAESAWGDYHVQPRLVTPREAAPDLLKDKDLCILINAPVQTGRPEFGSLTPEFAESLVEFVRKGKGLWIFGGDKVKPDAYNSIFYTAHGLLPLKLTSPLSANTAEDEEPWQFDAKSVSPKSYLASWREEPLDPIGQVETSTALGVEEPKKANRKQDGTEQASVLLRFNNGKPALVSKRVGNGEVLLVTTSADPTWTDWPIRPAYLPFIHLSLNYLLQGQVQTMNRVVGQPLRWNPPENDANRAFALIHPDGKRIRLGLPEVHEGDPTITAEDTSLAGVYRMLPADRLGAGVKESPESIPDGTPFAVIPDLSESADLSPLTNEQLDERLGIDVVHLDAAAGEGSFSGTERTNREWTINILAVLLGFVMFEVVLAWWCGRPW